MATNIRKSARNIKRKAIFDPGSTPKREKNKRAELSESRKEGRKTETPSSKRRRLWKRRVEMRVQCGKSPTTPKNNTPKTRTSVKHRKYNFKRRQLYTPTVSEAAAAFKKEICEGPIYVCTVCHRLLFKKGVRECH